MDPHAPAGSMDDSDDDGDDEGDDALHAEEPEHSAGTPVPEPARPAAPGGEGPAGEKHAFSLFSWLRRDTGGAGEEPGRPEEKPHAGGPQGGERRED